MIATLIQWFSDAQAWLFESTVQPFLFTFGLGDIAEETFDGTELFLLGLDELVLIYLQ